LEKTLLSTRQEMGRTQSTLRVDYDELRLLQTRVESLKRIIDDGNEERARLRRDLAAASLAASDAATVAAVERDTTEPDDDADAIEELPASRVRLPRFERAAERALALVPPLVASEAVRNAGHLASGDPTAWRGIKQARGMNSPVFMSRLGIHHRMVFRLDDG